jgi:hypothetical protein
MLVFCSSFYWIRRLPTVKLKSDIIPNIASSMAEVILIKRKTDVIQIFRKFEKL